MTKAFRKYVRKEAARCFMVRSNWPVVRRGWKVAWLMEERGLLQREANTRTGAPKNIAYMAYKQFLKYQKFVESGVKACEIVRHHTVKRRHIVYEYTIRENVEGAAIKGGSDPKNGCK